MSNASNSSFRAANESIGLLQQYRIKLINAQCEKYKRKYLRLLQSQNKVRRLLGIAPEKVNNFSRIVENAYDHAIEKFGDMYIIIDSDPYKIFRLHQFGEDKRYKFNRYLKSDAPMKCENKQFVINNPDTTYDFIKERGDSIFIDTKINKLPKNSSDGLTRWESYNWTLYRTPDKLFHIVFGRLDDSFKAEIGIKHTMLGEQNDFYAGGEIRIVHRDDQIIVQVNLDSSSFSPGFANILKNLCGRYKQCVNDKSLNEKITNFCPFGLKEEKHNIVCNNFDQIYDDIIDFKVVGRVPNQPKSHFEEPKDNIKYKELQKILNVFTITIKDVIKEIFTNLIDDPKYVLQVVGDDDWYDAGLKGRGLHYYYYNDICPTKEYINEANTWAKRHQYEEFIKEV